MTAPVMFSAGTYAQSTSGSTPPTFPVPASVTGGAGEVVLLAFMSDWTGTATSTPSGFVHASGSPVGGVDATGSDHQINIMWKRPSGADSTPYPFTWSEADVWSGRAFLITGCIASGNPWDTSGGGTPTAKRNSNSTTSPAVNITTTVANTLLFLGATVWSGGSWTPATAGGTWTEQMDSGVGTITVDTKTQAVAGATGSVTATSTGNDWGRAWLGALMPPSGAAAPVAHPLILNRAALRRASNW